MINRLLLLSGFNKEFYLSTDKIIVKTAIIIFLIFSISFAQKRVGIFTGTFDPIHKGHIQNIKTAIIEMDLDEVIINPLVQTPHKSPVLNFAQRLELVNIAIEDIPGAKTFSKEILEALGNTEAPHVSLVNYVKSDMTNLDHTFHIVGEDTFERIFFREAIIDETLSFKNHSILVLGREGYESNQVPRQLEGRVIKIDHPGGDMGFSSSSFRSNPVANRDILPKKVWNSILDKSYYLPNVGFGPCEKVFLGNPF